MNDIILKITLKNGAIVELTIAEAKELYTKLCDLDLFRRQSYSIQKEDLFKLPIITC